MCLLFTLCNTRYGRLLHWPRLDEHETLDPRSVHTCTNTFQGNKLLHLQQFHISTLHHISTLQTSITNLVL